MFDQRITRKLEGIYSSDLEGIQTPLAELQKLEEELHDKLILSMPSIEKTHMEDEVKNI